MPYSELVWIAGFIGSFSLLIVSLIILWVSIRDYFDDTNVLKNLLFSIGLVSVTASYLYRDAFSLPGVQPIIFAAVAVGFTLIGFSLLNKRWQLVLLLLPPLVFFLPFSKALSVTSILILVLAVLSLFNKQGFFSKEECDCPGIRKKHSNREWFIVFVLFSFISGFHIASNFVPSPTSLVFEIISITCRYLAALVIFYQIFHCVRFSKKEKYIFPSLFGFLIVLVLAGFTSTRAVIRREESALKESLMEETLSLKYLTEREYGEEELYNKFHTKDNQLNDFLDKVYIRTGIHGAYLLGDERIAAVPPEGTNLGRAIGTKLDNPEIIKQVLMEGKNFSGKINRGGSIHIGAYSPLIRDGKVFGIVAAGEPLDAEKYFNRDMFARAIMGAVSIMLLVLWVFLADKTVSEPKNRK